VSGTQRWSGRVEVYSTVGGSPTVYLDYLELVPVSAGYGKARATYSYRAGIVTGLDEFTGTTAGNNLNGRAAVSGGSWVTSGDATDFQFADDLSGEQITRATTADTTGRFAILGAGAVTDTEASVRFYADNGSIFTNAGVVARWVDSSNFLRLRATVRGTERLVLEQVVAGTTTTLATSSYGITVWRWYRLRLIAFASGRAIGQVLDANDNILATLDASSSALSSGGALDDGTPGIWDSGTGVTAGPRYYDQFTVATPAPEPIVLYSGRTMQITHEAATRQDSTGVYSGRPRSYQPAGRFLVPVGTSRVLAKARRNDIDAAADENVTDATQIQVGITPRGLAVPRG
jgi:hypothetical protein